MHETKRLVQTEQLRPSMKLLRSFKGLIATPVNHDNKHWGLLIVDKEGRAFYSDSLSWKVDRRIQLMAQIVLLIIHPFSLLFTNTVDSASVKPDGSQQLSSS